MKSNTSAYEPYCKLYGFVQYKNKEDAEEAMAELDGLWFCGRRLTADYEAPFRRPGSVRGAPDLRLVSQVLNLKSPRDL